MADLEAADATNDADFAVWPVNMPIVEAFCAVATQWRTTSLIDGRVLWQGLDYTAVRARLGDQTDAIWRGLAAMETAAAAVLNGRG